MQRRLTPELMDDPAVAAAQLENSLAYLRGVNRRLGGARALLAHLGRWSTRWPRVADAAPGALTIIDVATGSADIPIAVRRWGLARGFDLRITGIDIHEKTLDAARRFLALASDRDPRIAEGITLRCVDARRMVAEFGAGSFDYAHAALFLHHLPDIEVRTVLAGMDRLARRGIVWSDLHRSHLQRAVVGLATLGKPYIIRHDARVSIEAGFTRAEALEHAHKVGISYAHYSRPPLWHRFTVAGEKKGAWAL